MSRPILIRCKSHPYHITARCSEKDFFPLPLPEVWEIMIAQLGYVHLEFGMAIHAFILMGNHIHLLCHTPKANLDKVMQSFMRNSSIIISNKANKEGPLWDGSYKWSIIDNRNYYFQVYRYVFQNPLRAGIVKRVQDYPYSTLKRKVPFPIHSYIPLTFGGEEGELIWLNQRFNQKEQELIQVGLRKGQFGINQKYLRVFLTLDLVDREE